MNLDSISFDEILLIMKSSMVSINRQWLGAYLGAKPYIYIYIYIITGPRKKPKVACTFFFEQMHMEYWWLFC